MHVINNVYRKQHDARNSIFVDMIMKDDDDE